MKKNCDLRVTINNTIYMGFIKRKMINRVKKRIVHYVFNRVCPLDASTEIIFSEVTGKKQKNRDNLLSSYSIS